MCIRDSNPDVNLVTIPGYLPDYVTSQSLAAGTQVKRGTTVVISVEQPISTTTSTTTTTPSISGISGITG